MPRGHWHIWLDIYNRFGYVVKASPHWLKRRGRSVYASRLAASSIRPVPRGASDLLEKAPCAGMRGVLERHVRLSRWPSTPRTTGTRVPDGLGEREPWPSSVPCIPLRAVRQVVRNPFRHSRRCYQGNPVTPRWQSCDAQAAPADSVRLPSRRNRPHSPADDRVWAGPDRPAASSCESRNPDTASAPAIMDPCFRRGSLPAKTACPLRSPAQAGVSGLSGTAPAA